MIEKRKQELWFLFVIDGVRTRNLEPFPEAGPTGKVKPLVPFSAVTIVRPFLALIRDLLVYQDFRPVTGFDDPAVGLEFVCGSGHAPVLTAIMGGESRQYNY